MKKLITIITVILLILLVGCSSAPSPTNVVDDYLKSVQKDPFSKFNDQLNLDESSEEEVALFNQLSEMLKKQTYTLDNETINGDNATVDVHYKTYDYVSPLQDALKEYLAQAFASAFSGTETSQEELSNMMYKLYAEKLATAAESNPEKEFNYTVKLTKVDGKWEMEDLSSNNEFIDGFVGGLYTAFSNLSNNLGN